MYRLLLQFLQFRNRQRAERNLYKYEKRNFDFLSDPDKINLAENSGY